MGVTVVRLRIFLEGLRFSCVKEGGQRMLLLLRLIQVREEGEGLGGAQNLGFLLLPQIEGLEPRQ